MRYYTAEAIEALPSLADKSPEEVAVALETAGRVYKYIHRNEGITEEELRAYGERNDIDPDSMTLALGVLADQKRIYPIADDVPPPDPEREEG